MRALVTGGAGFIGSHLSDALIERGDEVVCVDNLVGTGGSTRNIDHLGSEARFHFVEADIVTWPIDLRGVDVIFHNAASKMVVCLDDPERDLEVNARATLRLVRAAGGVRKFVHASTGSVLDGTAVSFYGASKYAAEQYVRLAGHGLDWTILRYYHVIGPRQDDSEHGGVAAIFVRRALERKSLTIHGTGEQERSFTSVADVVRANLLVVDEPRSRHRTYTCASGIAVTINELAEFVRSEVHRVRVIHDARRVGEIDRFEIDNRGLRQLGLKFDKDWRGIIRGMAEVETVKAA